MLLYTGLSGVVGYEVFNKDIVLLRDGATLHNKSGVVYGGKGTLSIESYLSNHLVVFGFYKMSFMPKSGLTNWHSQIGMGTRIFIN